jgi:hypothetical protein
MSAGQRPELGEKKMESEKKKNGIGKYLNSGVAFLKALDFEINETRKYEVTGKEDRDFDEDGVKPMLILKGLDEEQVGLVLNRTNLDFLLKEGFEEFEELFGKTLTVKKEERIFEGKKYGKRKNIGLFIVKVE